MATDRPSAPLAAGELTWLLLALLLAALANQQIVHNYFAYDDFFHLYDLRNTGFWSFLLNPHGGHIYLFRNAVFALFYGIFGLHAELYFYAVLATHLLNVFLLFRILHSLSQSAVLACAGAALWGMSPINIGTLGWYTAYGQVLVTGMLLWILSDAVALVARAATPSRIMLARWYALLLAGATTFGIGIGFAFVFGAGVVLLVPLGRLRARAALIFASLIVVVPLSYVFLPWLHTQLYGQPHAGGLPSGLRPGLAHLIFLTDLTSFGTASLVLSAGVAGDVDAPALGPLRDVSESALRILSYVVAALALTLVGWGWSRAPRSQRRYLLFVLLLLGACYGSIATGRIHLFGDSPTELVRRARYHYAGPLLICILLGASLGQLGATLGRRSVQVALACTIVLAAALRFSIPAGVSAWRDPGGRALYEQAVTGMKRRIDKSEAGTRLYFHNREFGQEIWKRTPHLPGLAAIFIIAFPENTVDGKTIRFVERDRRRLEFTRLLAGSRIAELLVGPEDVPGAAPAAVSGGD